MSNKLRILILEDAPEDAELMEISLRKAGMEFVSQRVETREAFIEQLAAFAPDVLLLDYQIPRFDGLSALRLLKDEGVSAPAIIVTGSTNEEIAVKCMKEGADDYVLKNHLNRLAPAVEKALKGKRLRDEKAQVDEAVRASAQQWRATFDAIEDIVAIIGGDFRIIEANKAMKEVFADRKVVGTYCYELLHAASGPPPNCPTCQVFQTGEATHTEIIAEGLGNRWMDVFAYPIKSRGGVDQIVHVIRDVTQHKEMEQALRESEEKYRLVVENANEGIAVTQDGMLKFVNPKIAEVTGYSEEELTSRPFIEFVHPDDRALLEERREKRLKGEAPPPVYVFRSIDKGGNVKWVETRVVVIEWEGRPATLSFLTDVTDRVMAEEEREEMQAQFLQAQKMETIGRLAGGVAHDFNNVLTAVMSYSQFALEALDPNDPIYHDIEEIRKAGKRAEALTRQLLAFSHKQILNVQVLDLNFIITEMEKMLRRLIGEDINLITILDPELGRIKADPGQVEQVIMNLAVNARDAMPDGGDFSIETSNVELDERHARPLGVEPGRYVRLTASDTGIGMDDETRARIFDPFFTTKAEGRGTGLGLYTVYGIVKQSGGGINVASKPGEGATFGIHFPRVRDEVAVAERHDIPSEELGGSETILVVEDEAMVKETARRALHAKGYTVLEASNAGEAILLCEKYDQPIDLMITDIVMPVMNGLELAKRLMAMGKDMSVLYSSGYTEDEAALQEVLDAGLPFIQKPFTPDVLTHKVREVLDRTDNGRETR